MNVRCCRVGSIKNSDGPSGNKRTAKAVCARPRISQVRGRFILTLDASTTPATNARLDKWLWAVRVFKSRALATDACRAGSVEIAGQVAKPAREVRANDQVAVQLGLITRTLRVIGVPKSRVGAKLVPQFYEEMTPETEFAKLREHRVQNLLAREKGSGRPTKRDRRDLTRFFG
jgi:ribosome-associated heat shock protein Hsp15